MSKSTDRFASAILATLAVALCASCSDTAKPDPGEPRPTSLTLVAGDSQMTATGATLPDSILVLATDAGAAGMPGVTVRFLVTAGGGSVSAESVVTDAAGLARASWTLGGAAGLQSLSVRTAGAEGTIIFDVSATALLPSLITLTGGAFQSGAPNQPLPAPIRAVILDAAGDPVPGALVRFAPSAGGSATPDSAFTGETGEASAVWTLGPAAGDQQLEVRVPRPGRSTLVLTEPVWAGSLTTVIVTGGPYGLDVNAAGDVYATRLYAGSLAVGSVAGRTITGSVVVGTTPTGVTFNPAGSEAWVTNQLTGDVAVIDAATNAPVDTVDVPNDPFVVGFSPSGSDAFVATNLGMVYRVTAATRAITDSVFIGNGANGVAVNAAGTRLYVSAFAAGLVREVDLATFDVIRTFATGGQPQGLIVAPDGGTLYVANSGRLEAWNLATGALAATIGLPGGGFGLALSPDGATLAVSVLFTGPVIRIDRAAFTRRGAIPTGGDPRRLAWSADGQSLIIANLAGWIDFVP